MKIAFLLIVFIAGIMFPSHQAFGFGAGADNFGNATPVTGESNYSDPTDLLNNSLENNEPVHSPVGAFNLGRTAWWSFTPTDDGYCTIDTQKSIATYHGVSNTVVAVYTGTNLNALTRIVSSNKAPTSPTTYSTALAQVRFFALKNTTYRIVVDGSFSLGNDQNYAILQVRHLPLRKTAYTSLVTLDTTIKQMGLVNVNTTDTGSISGKLTLGLKTFSFAGAFNIEGRFFFTFIPKGTKITTPVTIVVDGVYNPSFQLLVFGENMQSAALVEKRVFTSTAPSTLTGTYTAATNPDPTASGSAFLTFKIKPNGLVTAVGFAQDGSPFTASSSIHYPFQTITNGIILYKSMDKGKSEMALITDVIESGATDIMDNGVGIFHREPGPSALYPAGLDFSFTIKGATYTKPVTNTRPYGFLNPNGDGFFRIPNSAEVVGGIDEAVNLTTKNKFTFANAAPAPVLKLNPGTGLLTGTMVLPNGAKSTIKGILHLSGGVPVIKGFATGTAEHHGLTISNL